MARSLIIGQEANPYPEVVILDKFHGRLPHRALNPGKTAKNETSLQGILHLLINSSYLSLSMTLIQ